MTITETRERTWLSYAEAERYTGVHRTTIWRAVKAGELKASGPGRAVRFHRDDLDEWMRGAEK